MAERTGPWLPSSPSTTATPFSPPTSSSRGTQLRYSIPTNSPAAEPSPRRDSSPLPGSACFPSAHEALGEGPPPGGICRSVLNSNTRKAPHPNERWKDRGKEMSTESVSDKLASPRDDQVTPAGIPDAIAVPPGNEVFLVGHASGTQNYICLLSFTDPKNGCKALCDRSGAR